MCNAYVILGPFLLPGACIYVDIHRKCHGTTCIISRINHLHPLTITRVLITNTCNHLPPPFISSLTSVTHQLVSRLHGSLHWSMCAGLPVHPGTRPYLWERKFTYSDTVHPASSALCICVYVCRHTINHIYCDSSAFKYHLNCLSSPFLSISLSRCPSFLIFSFCFTMRHCCSSLLIYFKRAL